MKEKIRTWIEKIKNAVSFVVIFPVLFILHGPFVAIAEIISLSKEDPLICDADTDWLDWIKSQGKEAAKRGKNK